MQDESPPSGDSPQAGASLAQAYGLPISAVERDTGLSKDTLRVWERRYGFPQPMRDTSDERLYPRDQVERLRLIARLLGSGLRPGRLVPLPMGDLKKLAQQKAPASGGKPPGPEQQAILQLLQRHEALELRRTLNQAVIRLGLARFLTEMLAPMNEQLGEAWIRGEIRTFHEHTYTKCVTAVLRGALGTAMPMPGMPRVLLAGLPQETHLLGLLMAEAMLVLEGCECASLGAQTPVSEIALATQANRAGIVGLSLSPALPTPELLRDLEDLRRRLPASVQIWVSGQHTALHKRLPEGIVRVPQLQAITALLDPWRSRAGWR